MNKKVKRKNRVIIWLIILLFVLIACDARLKTVVYTVESDKVDESIRLALLTDLHSCRYGGGQKTLLDAVDEAKPDIVLLGGDIFEDDGDYEHTQVTLKHLADKYPCYYVTGNHEYWGGDAENILDIVESYGIKSLSGECDTIEIDGQFINICGVDDPDVMKYFENADDTRTQLAAAEAAADALYYTVLLAHRPELVDIYAEYDFDLVLSGHAHGGQWRIPGILNGLYAPNQGLFPEYAGGRYDHEEWVHIVSRGLARESTLVPRIFNRPELVIVEIK